MKKIYLLLALTCLATASFSQIRMAILGGPHSASVKEKNNIPAWETTIKPGYSSRSGLNLGVLAEIPLAAGNTKWFLHTGIQYTSKGRKFYQSNDTLTSELTDTISASHNLAVNYIDIPFNLTYKIPLGAKSKFLISAGPYLGLFYNGKQKFATRFYSTNSFKDDEVNLETGNSAGKMKTVNFGVNARAGFELGNILITGFFSEGLSSFYTASYEGSFKHQVRGVSVGFWLNKAKPIVRTIKDSDKDGVPDATDSCPQAAGAAITKGCPDRDDDGIADQLDKCPEVAGKSKYQGCPVPDSDADGINDEADACPQLAGIAEFNGCPVPDSDGDGLNDQQDRCPTEAGPKDLQGCPAKDTIVKQVEKKIQFAAKHILFKASSNELTESSYPAMDDVVKLLQLHERLTMIIEGHTDSTGSVETNRKLSSARADAVKQYLVSKGINAGRLQSLGLASSHPIAPNDTPEGRRMNRRVELKLQQ